MKQLLIITFSCLIFIFGCNPETVDFNEDKHLSANKKIEDKLHELTPEQFENIVIEGCEYIVFKDHLNANQGYGFMAHKGNCKNPIHCYNNPPTPQTDSLNMSQ